MAARKGSRSSKTDHVLNLLSHPTAAEQPAGEETAAPQPARARKEPSAAPASKAAAEAPAPKPAAVEPVQERRLTPPILEVARTNNEALEETIHSALETALMDELEGNAASESAPAAPEAEPMDAASATEPVGTDTPAAETASKEPAEVPEGPAPAAVPPEASQEVLEEAVTPVDAAGDTENASLEEDAPATEPPQKAKGPAPQPSKEPAKELLPPDDARFINVMEQLVSEKLEKYVKLFHLCDCPRCLADARALALSRLPAKYVVLSTTTYRPMMSYYEAKFDSAVTTQIIYACKQVMESPRHSPRP